MNTKTKIIIACAAMFVIVLAIFFLPKGTFEIGGKAKAPRAASEIAITATASYAPEVPTADINSTSTLSSADAINSWRYDPESCFSHPDWLAEECMIRSAVSLELKGESACDTTIPFEEDCADAVVLAKVARNWKKGSQDKDSCQVITDYTARELCLNPKTLYGPTSYPRADFIREIMEAP